MAEPHAPLQQNIEALVAWHDTHRVPEVVRMLKLGEEAGEAVTEYFGYRGLNPRKGVTNGVDSVILELADTALAALVALESLAPGQALDALIDRTNFVRSRLEAGWIGPGRGDSRGIDPGAECPCTTPCERTCFSIDAGCPVHDRQDQR